MSRYPSCFVSKAVARARPATDRLTKIISHHELRLRGLARRTNGGTRVRQGSDFFAGRFRNAQSSPSAPASPVQSSRKRGVIEIVGMSFLVGLGCSRQIGPRHQSTSVRLARNAQKGTGRVSRRRNPPLYRRRTADYASLIRRSGCWQLSCVEGASVLIEKPGALHITSEFNQGIGTHRAGWRGSHHA
jgi:hypothetical protein